MNELDQLQPGSRREFEKILAGPAFFRIAGKGELAEFLHDADLDTQVQLQPLIERVQNIAQVSR